MKLLQGKAKANREVDVLSLRGNTWGLILLYGMGVCIYCISRNRNSPFLSCFLMVFLISLLIVHMETVLNKIFIICTYLSNLLQLHIFDWMIRKYLFQYNGFCFFFFFFNNNCVGFHVQQEFYLIFCANDSEDGTLSCGYSSFRGKRPSMEDFYDVKISKIDGTTVCLFGIFDGQVLRSPVPLNMSCFKYELCARVTYMYCFYLEYKLKLKICCLEVITTFKTAYSCEELNSCKDC